MSDFVVDPELGKIELITEVYTGDDTDIGDSADEKTIADKLTAIEFQGDQ